MLIRDYFSSNPYAILRTWITYTATEYLHPTSVTFTIKDTDYRFSGIGDKKWSSDDGSGSVREKMLIIYNNTSDHIEFLFAMLDWASTLLNDDESDDYEINMTIHGISDVETTLGKGPAYDLFAIFMAMAEIGGSLEDSGGGSTLKITPHK